MQALCSAICNQKGKGVQCSEPVESSMPKLLISMEKKKDFQAAWWKKLGARGNRALLEHSRMQLLNFCNYNRKKVFKSCAISIVGQI